MFMRIIDGAKNDDDYFELKMDFNSRYRLFIIASFLSSCMLADGVVAGQIGEYIPLGESTCLDKFL
jgi:hypothetical protein